MKHRKALVSEEELLETKSVRKASKKASETREQTLHKQEQNQTHMISIINTSAASWHQGFCTSVLFIVWGFVDNFTCI